MERIRELRHEYYEGNGSTASDAEYDGLVHRLEALEQEHPDLAAPDSPTRTVGGAPETALFAPVVHAEPMLSLDNVFSIEELQAWAAKVQRDAAKVAPDRPVRWLSRAEDRRARDQPPLRARRARLRRHPRRRDHR